MVHPFTEARRKGTVGGKGSQVVDRNIVGILLDGRLLDVFWVCIGFRHRALYAF